VGNTATIVTTGSIQEIAKYNIYNLYIFAIGNTVSRLQSTQPSIPSGQVNRELACLAGVKAGCVQLRR